MAEFTLLPMPNKCLLLPEVLQAELTDVQLIQVIELLWVRRVIPGEDLILAKIDRLHQAKACFRDKERKVKNNNDFRRSQGTDNQVKD